MVDGRSVRLVARNAELDSERVDVSSKASKRAEGDWVGLRGLMGG
jgi:hypothetical protein